MALSFLWDLLFPRTCAVCARDLPGERDPLCAGCVAEFPRWDGLACRVCGLPLPDGGARCWTCRWRRRSFRFCRSAGLYEGGLKECVLLLKYAGRDALARPLGRFLADAFRGRRELARCEAVVPVPLHFFRRHRRGYNQAALIARAFCGETGLPLREGVLARRRHTPSQARLGRDARRGNVAEAFQVVRADAVRGRALLLIDDVCTTGATLEACAAALTRAGAAWVSALTVARQP